ncbi:MAG TPA: DUF4157 domain-containing protein [Polyangiaceae bacterium]|nr:DUF4157 domain-containing protein [Polyangiaceae bacterium]
MADTARDQASEKESSERAHAAEAETVAVAALDSGLATSLTGVSPADTDTSRATHFFAQRSTRGQHAAAMRQIQRHRGNRYAQRVMARLSAQRQCACGGTCSKCREAEAPTPVVRARMEQAAAAPATMPARELMPADSAGQPLPREARGELEEHFGADLGNVRVHTDSAAERGADLIAADAYTIGSDIYFAEGKYDPSSPDGRKLLAHEVAHTQQQPEAEAGGVQRSGNEELPIGAPDDALEVEAEGHAEAFIDRPREGEAPSVTADRAPAVRRRGTLGRAQDWIVSQVERLAPGVVQFFTNIRTYLATLIQNGVASLFGGIAAQIREKGVAGALVEIITGLASGMLQAAGGFVTGACGAIGEVAEYLIQIHVNLGAAAFEGMKRGFEATSATLSALWTEYATPAIDFVRRKLGAAWIAVTQRLRQFWDWLAPLRNAAAAVWSQVTGLIGEGLSTWERWNEWLINKALDVWDDLKKRLLPFMGTVKTAAKVIGAVLLILSPAGPFVILGGMIYGAYRAVRSLWEQYGKGWAREVRKWWVEHGVPVVQSALKSFHYAVGAAKTATSAALGQAHDAIMSVLDALGVLDFLASVREALASFGRKVAELRARISHTIEDWSVKIGAFIAKAEPYLSLIRETLRQTLLVALVGPLAILDDSVWNTVQSIVGFVMRTPCLREIGGLMRVPSMLALAGRMRANIKAAWELMRNPEPILSALRDALEPMVQSIEPEVRRRVAALFTEREHRIQLAILHYLSESFAQLGSGWWPMLKKMGWDLLWPWEEVGKEFMPMLEDFGAALSAAFNLEFSLSVDKFLSGMKRFNTMAGAVSGWFLIASVLIGGVLGAFGFVAGPMGGATVAAGMASGAALAEQVGVALIVIAISTELAVLEKSKFDLLYLNPRIQGETDRDKADDDDCKAIAGSIVAVVTMGALMLLGALAQKIASAIASLARRVRSFFSELRGGGAARPRVGAAEPVGEPARPGEPNTARDPAADPDTTARPGDFTPEQLDTAQRRLAERVNDPANVREVSDPALRDRYDLEVDLGDGQTFRRRRDGTWCLFRNPIECGLSATDAVNAAADARARELEASRGGEQAPEHSNPEAPAGTSAWSRELSSELKPKFDALAEADQARLRSVDINVAEDVLGSVGKKASSKTAPEGYTYVNPGEGRRPYLRRSPPAETKPPLHVDPETGEIRVGPGRTSNRIAEPGRLRENLGSAPGEGHQAHHLVPDEVVRKEELFQEALRRGIYDVDRPSNGIYLPETPEVRVPATENLPLHSGSHPAYNSQARQAAQTALREELAAAGKTRATELSDAQLLDAIELTEQRMRDQLEAMMPEEYVR